MDSDGKEGEIIKPEPSGRQKRAKKKTAAPIPTTPEDGEKTSGKGRSNAEEVAKRTSEWLEETEYTSNWTKHQHLMNGLLDHYEKNKTEKWAAHGAYILKRKVEALLAEDEDADVDGILEPEWKEYWHEWLNDYKPKKK